MVSMFTSWTSGVLCTFASPLPRTLHVNITDIYPPSRDQRGKHRVRPHMINPPSKSATCSLFRYNITHGYFLGSIHPTRAAAVEIEINGSSLTHLMTLGVSPRKYLFSLMIFTCDFFFLLSAGPSTCRTSLHFQSRKYPKRCNAKGQGLRGLGLGCLRMVWVVIYRTAEP